MKKQINMDIPHLKANPKGPDGYARTPDGNIFSNSKDFIDPSTIELRDTEQWMGREEQYNATLGGFNVQLVISPSRRNWHMRVDIPEHFDHKDFNVLDHICVSSKSIRDI